MEGRFAELIRDREERSTPQRGDAKPKYVHPSYPGGRPIEDIVNLKMVIIDRMTTSDDSCLSVDRTSPFFDVLRFEGEWTILRQRVRSDVSITRNGEFLELCLDD